MTYMTNIMHILGFQQGGWGAALLAASSVTLALSVLGFILGAALGATADTSRMLYASNIAGLTAAGDMRTTIADVRIASRNALLEPDPVKGAQILAHGLEKPDDRYVQNSLAALEWLFPA